MFLPIYFLYISGATENQMTLITSVLDISKLTKKNHLSQINWSPKRREMSNWIVKMTFPSMTKRTVYTSMASITKVWLYIWCNLAAAISWNINLMFLILQWTTILYIFIWYIYIWCSYTFNEKKSIEIYFLKRFTTSLTPF